MNKLIAQLISEIYFEQLKCFKLFNRSKKNYFFNTSNQDFLFIETFLWFYFQETFPIFLTRWWGVKYSNIFIVRMSKDTQGQRELILKIIDSCLQGSIRFSWFYMSSSRLEPLGRLYAVIKGRQLPLNSDTLPKYFCVSLYYISSYSLFSNSKYCK